MKRSLVLAVALVIGLIVAAYFLLGRGAKESAVEEQPLSGEETPSEAVVDTFEAVADSL